MRLIDADVLEEKLKDYLKNKIDNHSYEIDVTDCNVELQTLLESMPTAYNMDKVVKQLQEKENESVLKAPNTDCIHNTDYQKWMMKSYGFKEAIEIVKAGDINEK